MRGLIRIILMLGVVVGSYAGMSVVFHSGDPNAWPEPVGHILNGVFALTLIGVLVLLEEPKR